MNKLLALILLLAPVISESKPLKMTSKAPALNVKASVGTVPPSLPQKLSIGLFEDTYNNWMKNSGAAWNIRYRYITYGFSNNWGYGVKDASFVTDFLNETDSMGFIPALALYEMYDLPPANTGFGAKTQNAAAMLEYFGDIKLLMQRAKDFGKPVLIMVEADGTGYLQGDSNSNPNAPAAIASSGMPELAGLPNTAAGWSLAFLQLRKSVGANNVLLGMHVSGWATGADLFHFSVTEPLQPAVDSVYNFLAPGGLVANVTGSTYDLLIGDPLDRDADFYRLNNGEDRWWDMSDTASVNSKSFNRYAEWVRLWNLKSGKRWVLWQVPIGNSQSLNNCSSGYKDNRTEYFFGANGQIHRQKFVDNGVVALLFGAGADCQTTQETDHGYLLTNAKPYLSGSGTGLGDAGTVIVDAGTVIVDAGVPVVDSGVPDAGRPDSGVIVDAGVPQSLAMYEFETGTQNWYTIGKVVSGISSSAVKAASGAKSLGMTLGAVGGTQQVLIDNPPVPQGKTITFKVFFSAGTRLTSVQVFAQEGIATNWRWNGVWRQISALTPGVWNTLTVPLPANSSTLQSLGIELTAKKGTAGEVVYLDSVGWNATVTVDAGVPVIVDSGVVDSGTPVVDAGKPDAGKVDSGVADSGTPPVFDAGVIAGQLRYMPLGDSITAAEWSWRCAIFQDFVASGRSAVSVGPVQDQYDSCTPRHAGNSGWTIGDLQAAVQGPSGWIVTYKPDLVILMAGSNDCLWWQTETGTQIAEHLNDMITSIQQLRPGIRIVVQTIPPTSSVIIAPNNVDRVVLVNQFNARLRDLVASRVASGQLVRLADINSVLVLSDTYDNVHPSPEAAVLKMAPVIWNAIQPLLP